jgi:hypothetical protein
VCSVGVSSHVSLVFPPSSETFTVILVLKVASGISLAHGRGIPLMLYVTWFGVRRGGSEVGCSYGVAGALGVFVLLRSGVFAVTQVSG